MSDVLQIYTTELLLQMFTDQPCEGITIKDKF